FEFFGISNAEVDVRCELLCRFDDASTDVNTCDIGPECLEKSCRPASAGRHIEAFFAGLWGDPGHDMSQCVCNCFAHPVVCGATRPPDCGGPLILRSYRGGHVNSLMGDRSRSLPVNRCYQSCSPC